MKMQVNREFRIRGNIRRSRLPILREELFWSSNQSTQLFTVL
jgi:hypothetical protein